MRKEDEESPEPAKKRRKNQDIRSFLRTSCDVICLGQPEQSVPYFLQDRLYSGSARSVLPDREKKFKSNSEPFEESGVAENVSHQEEKVGLHRVPHDGDKITTIDPRVTSEDDHVEMMLPRVVVNLIEEGSSVEGEGGMRQECAKSPPSDDKIVRLPMMMGGVIENSETSTEGNIEDLNLEGGMEGTSVEGDNEVRLQMMEEGEQW